jgi:hypothetical protein
MGCFRSLLLVICPYLSLTKALAADLEPSRVGDVKIWRQYIAVKILHWTSLMTEAPVIAIKK